MKIEVILPKMGFDMESGIFVGWLKQIGDNVQAGEPLFEVETDKATLQVESLDSGKLLEINASEGQEIGVGTVIGYLDDGKTADLNKAEVKTAEKTELKAQAESVVSKSSSTKTQKEERAIVKETNRVLMSPLARKIAVANGIDVSQLTGSGVRGMIIKQDVNALMQKTQASSDETSHVSIQSGRTYPLTKMRKIIASRMSQSNRDIPQFSLSMAVDMEKALELVEQYNNGNSENELSINSLFVRASALSLTKFPNLNSSLVNDELLVHPAVNIGIAVALDGGLITMVLKAADQKVLPQINAEAKALITRARENKIKLEDSEGSTFTISNLGMYGVEEFNAIVNPPEAAILAVGMIDVVPKYINGTFEPRRVVKCNLTIDHRISDGAEAASFLRQIKRFLEEPINLFI